MSPADGRDRAAHVQPALVGLVVVGGTVGTALRDRLETVFATPAGELPWATFGINVSGAFLLGLLVEVLAVAVGEGRRRRAVRLTLGTGLLGGFTTYSTFVVEAIAVAGHDALVLAVAYLMASVLAGFAAACGAMAMTRWAVRAWGKGAGP